MSLSQTGTAQLGVGRPLFLSILMWQTLGVVVFMPLLTCSAIAGERERQTMDVLFTTRLSPTLIVMEKLFARLIPMWSLQFASMPLIAFAYSLGGVSDYELMWSIIGQLALTLQVGYISIACSAKFGTINKTLLMSYLIVGASVICCFPTSAWLWVGSKAQPMSTVFLLGPIAVVCFVAHRKAVSGLITAQVGLKHDIRRDLLFDKRIFVAGDYFDTLLRGMIRRPRSLPDDDPVYWRERMHRWACNRSNFMMRWTIIFSEWLVVASCVLAGSSQTPSGSTSFWPALFSVLLVPAVVSKAVATLKTERSLQTYDSLISTPISGRDIIQHKLYEVKQTINFFAIPMLTALLCEFYWRWGAGFNHYTNVVMASVGYMIFFPRLLMWFSFWLGIKLRSTVACMVLAIGVVLLLAFFPHFHQTIIMNRSSIITSQDTMLISLSPTSMFELLFCDQRWIRVPPSASWFTLWTGVGWIALSRHCMRNADKMLGRQTGESK